MTRGDISSRFNDHVATYVVEDLGAGADIVDRCIFVAPEPCVIQAIKLVANATTTTINTGDDVRIAVRDLPVANPSAVLVADRTFNAGHVAAGEELTANVVYDVTMSSPVRLDANATLLLGITQSAGANLPLCLVQVIWTKTGLTT